MILERFPEIQKLSPDERKQLYTELGDTLFIDEPVTDPRLIALLDERWAEYQRNPSMGRTWAEVKERIFSKDRPSSK
jgi:putative addiction module component (TIGR02574 family)